MARERKVYPRDTVAHLFAHRAQDEARDPGGNFYFTGDTLYSYGSHYVIARLLPERYTRDGSAVVLFNADGSSNTTNKHRGTAQQALRHMDVIEVPGLRQHDGATEAAAHLVKAMRAKINAATAPRIKPPTRAGHIRDAAIYARDAHYLLTAYLDNGKAEAADTYSPEAHNAKRKRARAMLRTIPEQSAFPYVADMAHKDAAAACEAFAAPILRDEYRANMEQHLHGFRRADMHARGDGDGLKTADYQHDRARAALQHYAEAEHAARLGKARIPAADRKRAAALREALPGMAHLAAKEARGRIEDRYNAAVAEARDLIASEPESWRIAHMIGHAKAYARELSETDTPEQAAARDNTIAALDKAHADALQASAPERYAATLARARARMDAGSFSDASALAARSLRIAEEHGLGTHAARALADTIRDAMHAANAERIAEWREGRGGAYLDRDMTGGDAAGALLRYNAEREVIETSWGADVPANVAPLVWRLVTTARRDNAARAFNGDAPTLGYYKLDRVTAEGDIRAGCHLIRYSELQRMAEVMGLAQAPEGAAA